MAITIPKNEVDYGQEVRVAADKILADFAEYRKHPDADWDKHTCTLFITDGNVKNDDVIREVAKDFKKAGYHVWVERNLGRYRENGHLAVTARPIRPNVGNNYCMM